MAHPRKKLRELAKARLMNATAAEDRVWATITPPIELESTLRDEGPVAFVYMRNEEIRHEDFPTSGRNGAVRRRLDMEITAAVIGGMVDDKLDDMAEQIEALFEDWEPEGFLGARIELKDTDLVVVDSHESTMGMLFMSYEIVYYYAYRKDVEDEWIPDDVFVVPNNTLPPEQVIFSEDED